MKIMGLIALALGIAVTECMAYLFQYNVEGTGTWFAMAMVLLGLVVSVAGTILFIKENKDRWKG